MNTALESNSVSSAIAILGVPFDSVTMSEALEMIARMVASRRPHHLVTANVDFLAQSRGDVELRRILLDAHLVLCDGTPVVWASRLLGNPLPERVAGADLVPRLIRIAAEKNLRLFFLGGTPASMSRALANLKSEHPRLQVEGFSPPFNHLLEMDHDEIKRRIAQARPDMLFVSFGCPKQEKWIAMNYQSLGVPVAIGVGGTIDFLAGQLKRAPVWMQRTGTEWVFRLLQEPRRLFRRYARDMGVFGWSLFVQWLVMRLPKRKLMRCADDHETCGPRSFRTRKSRVAGEILKMKTSGCSRGLIGFVPRRSSNHDLKKTGSFGSRIKACAEWQWIRLPDSLDVSSVRNDSLLCDPILADGRHCLLQMDRVRFIDSTGMGWLMRLHKKVRATGKQLVLIAPNPAVKRALALERLQDLFAIAHDCEAAKKLIHDLSLERQESVCVREQCRDFPGSLPRLVVSWCGEITAANADPVWEQTVKLLAPNTAPPQPLVIDLSQVRFMDSSGLGLMVRAQKLAQRRRIPLNFANLQPAVLNVLRIARLENFLLGELA